MAIAAAGKRQRRSDAASHGPEVEALIRDIRTRNPHEPEFHQVVEEFLESIMPWYLEHSHYREAAILERLLEPDRVISFRVS